MKIVFFIMLLLFNGHNNEYSNLDHFTASLHIHESNPDTFVFTTIPPDKIRISSGTRIFGVQIDEVGYIKHIKNDNIIVLTTNQCNTINELIKKIQRKEKDNIDNIHYQLETSYAELLIDSDFYWCVASNLKFYRKKSLQYYIDNVKYFDKDINELLWLLAEYAPYPIMNIEKE